MIYILMIIAVIVGSLMPIQASINAELTKLLKNPYLGAFISFSMGTFALFVACLIQGNFLTDLKRLTLASPYHFLGGLFGALFVGSSIVLIPKLGATTLMAAFVTGQLLMSLVLDHYGWFGVTVQPVSLQRVSGVILLFTGLLLIVKKAA